MVDVFREQKMIIDECVYFYATEEPHHDNSATMDDFLEHELPDGFNVIIVDGSYANIQHSETGFVYEAHAGGDGDFIHHRIDFVQL